MRSKLFSLSFLIVCILASCNIEFDKTRWNEDHDRAFPSVFRKAMLDDLVEKHRLVGLSYKQLVKKLGVPDHVEDSLVVYQIEIEYGGDTDPIYNKSLDFILSKDSLVRSLRIDEWKK